jgi:hypothetical protein
MKQKRMYLNGLCMLLYSIRKLTGMLFVVVCLSLALSAVSVPGNSGKVYAKTKTEKYTGWKESGKSKYYYKNGIRVTGWTEIGGKIYAFDKNGKLIVNQITGSKKKGYYYVDENGVRVTSAEIQAAVSFVMKNSSSTQTKKQRLMSCYWALCKYPYKRIYGDTPSAKKISSYALYMLNNRTGNCYRYASAMACIARVLGYESRVAVGGVTARSTGALSPHGWCEVKFGAGWWKMFDCSMQRAHTSSQLYMVTRQNYPFRLRCDAVYTLSVKNGKVSWS